jgi:hypothetical protein
MIVGDVVGVGYRHFRLLGLFLILLCCFFAGGPAHADTVTCPGGEVAAEARLKGGSAAEQPDLVVSGACTVRPGQTYNYGNVNILANGSLTFTETHSDGTTPGDEATEFWASSIIIEGDGTRDAAKGGAMLAGSPTAPYGSAGNRTGTLTIHLYGADQSNGNPLSVPGQGTLCKSTQKEDVTGPCGIPWDVWVDNGNTQFTGLPGGVTDYFYQYSPLYLDGAGTPFSATPYNPGTQGYFGYKVLGVSYGGTLALYGAKGADYSVATDNDPTDSGLSWIRLAEGRSLAAGATQLTVEKSVAGSWHVGDRIVVTTTDYLPSHSEDLTIDKVEGATITFHRTGCSGDGCGVRWPHNGKHFPLADRLATAVKPNGATTPLGMDQSFVTDGIETRAAVALLTRSIRIITAGDTDGQSLEDATAANPNYMFGGHTVVRQGARKFQVQGVEFSNLGQGGRLAHYPVHFHMARTVPADTFVKDSSVSESMTRWFVVHSTLGVTLQRNVGYRSIGHGYYLEDATETDNKFYSNIGILARAAVSGPLNPRNIPGILADNGGDPAVPLRGSSDYNYPAVFWITNGWNDFQGNMAAGAGTCGACYWFVPAFNDDMGMKWSGYSALQKNVSFAGTTPLKTFYKNSCSTAMNAFETVSSAPPCQGVNAANNPQSGYINAVKSIAPTPSGDISMDTYYPHFDGGSSRLPTVCKLDADAPGGYDCSGIEKCANGDALSNCAVVVLDHFTTSFNWADYNFAAIWLRQYWYLLDNSAMTDVQNSGLTFVTGGDYSRSSVIEGYWSLASHTAFVGTTQPDNPWASEKGPFNSGTGAVCNYNGNSCRNVDEAVSIQLSAFGVAQRLLSIYDGPSYQDANAYLDILKTPCLSFADCMYFNVPGIRKDPPDNTGTGYLPNAAIGWKQPNGFYYPPAFHSANLFFDNVAIRHYVNIPLFEPTSTSVTPPVAGTYITDRTAEADQYINPGFTFSGFTDIDRQTVLNDTDGSLGGLTSTGTPSATTMVNNDTFFHAPVATSECKSNIGVNPTAAGATCAPTSETPPTAVTSPYDYLTTAIIPSCALDGSAFPCGISSTTVDQGGGRLPEVIFRGGQWSQDCSSSFCFGVPLYRQFLTGSGSGAGTLEFATWIANHCASASPTGPAPVGCQFPFIRMGTQNTFQRSAMTIDHGTYYIDTTVAQKTQADSQFNDPTSGYVDCSIQTTGPCQQLSVNAFVGGQTYYVYFIYAKGTTKQIYQMYVGPDFKLDTDVKAVRMTLGKVPYAPVGTIDWSTTGWTRELINGLDGKKDVLQITVDMTNFAAELNPANAPGGVLTNSTCKPNSFCSWNGSSCGCALADNDPRVLASPTLKASCQHACQAWSQKDLDCPDAGCLGFAFTMPATFVAADQNERPLPQPFNTTTKTAGFTAMFGNTAIPPDNAAPGTCYYASLPNACPGPPD